MKFRRFIPLALSVVGLLVFSNTVQAQDSKLAGLAVGTKAPDFRLKDQAGKEHALSTLLKRGKVALVFYRSADW